MYYELLSAVDCSIQCSSCTNLLLLAVAARFRFFFLVALNVVRLVLVAVLWVPVRVWERNRSSMLTVLSIKFNYITIGYCYFDRSYAAAVAVAATFLSVTDDRSCVSCANVRLFRHIIFYIHIILCLYIYIIFVRFLGSVVCTWNMHIYKFFSWMKKTSSARQPPTLVCKTEIVRCWFFLYVAKGYTIPKSIRHIHTHTRTRSYNWQRWRLSHQLPFFVVASHIVKTERKTIHISVQLNGATQSIQCIPVKKIIIKSCKTKEQTAKVKHTE